MTLQQLLYVLTVSDEKSMNKAAEKLFVSQPTLTSAIQSLEKELDIQIFNRTSHGVTVTNQGREFLYPKRRNSRRRRHNRLRTKRTLRSDCRAQTRRNRRYHA